MIFRYCQRNPEVVIILAGVSAALHVGKLSPALPILRDALGVTLLQAGFLLSLVQLAGMLLGVAVGVAADGIGLKRSMCAGLVLLSIAAAAGGWAQDAGSLLVLRALEGVGFLLVGMPAPGLIRRLVPTTRSKASLGYWGAYMPFGTALALLVGPLVLVAFGWRVWWWSLAGLSFGMAVWVWCCVPPDRLIAAEESGHGAEAPVAANVAGGWLSRLRRTVSAPGPWLVALCFAVYSGQWLAVIGFLPSIYAQNEATGLVTAAPLALVAAVNMGGNIASGSLLQRGVPAQVLLYTGFWAMGLGALLAFSSVPAAFGAGFAPGLRYFGVLMFSMIGGLIPGTLFSLAVLLAPDEASVSTTVGWMQQWSSMGQFAGPPLVAWVAGIAGGWHWTWVVTGACCVVGLILAGQVGRQVGR